MSVVLINNILLCLTAYLLNCWLGLQLLMPLLKLAFLESVMINSGIV